MAGKATTFARPLPVEPQMPPGHRSGPIAAAFEFPARQGLFPSRHADN